MNNTLLNLCGTLCCILPVNSVLKISNTEFTENLMELHRVKTAKQLKINKEEK